MISRRTFLAGTGAALLAAPLAAEAQQARKIWRIGVLAGSPPTTPEAARPWEALMQGLRELGYVEGQNLAIERRWAEGRAVPSSEPEPRPTGLRTGVMSPTVQPHYLSRTGRVQVPTRGDFPFAPLA